MTSNNEIIMMDKQYLIETNEKILKRHKKLTGEQVWIGTTNAIDDVIPHVDSVGNSGDRKTDLIEKATNLMAKITHCQPFEDGNRRTGIVSATKFLQDNGYDIDIESGQANLDIRKMLKEIKLHSRALHVETMNQLSFYISKRIKPYEPTRREND
jgi:prophage maintenance system killer protein